MNKKLAYEKSLEGKLSVGELRSMINEARPRGGMSRVNPVFTLAQVCDIYERALESRPTDKVLPGMIYDAYKQRDVASGDSLTIRNILRDCG